MHYTPPLVAGVVFAGLLAAIMSTANSFLNLGAAALVRDIPISLTRRTLPRELFWSRVATVALLFLSAVFALYMQNLVALLGVFGWGTFAAAIVPAVCVGLNWKRATGAACIASVAVSLVLNFSLELAARHKLYILPYGFNVGAFSLLASLVVFIAVSWLTGRDEERRLPADVKAVMEL
jgi:Na+/proline symporter